MSWQGDICDFYLERRHSDDNIRVQQTNGILPPNLNLSYEANRHRTSVSSSSGSSVWEPPSPSAPIQRRSSIPICSSISEPGEEAEDAPWNLVAYHIPWGPGYEGYEAGTLPGPDGACIFLRSPTPLKRQRTSQACDKCRERKAKCSGTRPTCGRCSERGFLCVYSSGQAPIVTGEIPGSPTKVHRKLSYCSSKEQLKTSAVKNRVRRKSSQIEATASTSLNHNTLQAFPRRHSQPVASAHSLAPLPPLPIVSMLQKQLHIEEEQAVNDGAETLGEEVTDSKGMIDTIGNPNLHYSMSQQSLNFYAQSITALNAYRFPPPCIENTPVPLVTCSPDVLAPAIYHVDNGLSIQLPASVPPETLWQVPEYDPQLGAKSHDTLLNIESFPLDTSYTGMSQHASTARINNSFEQEQQMAYRAYFHSYRSDFEP